MNFLFVLEFDNEMKEFKKNEIENDNLMEMKMLSTVMV